ncbi:MAG: bifunctional phosphoribosyl-AMP cyclohydrolase/phosphoribosyl-ATP diphosphatase HisIE [Saprospiraceae bacterium]|nr:bifunctional phosphoribosyl-AMP cyclohydrolase/phosphoribosyl-ATP diphosphatase HisIE [Saprospiraceae bacterium]MBL0099659.1 bifunctional phosphoribosyl-AMP cyclohydrolase/phosphoribosyl-ATP diphosphatase HisIE [Saprospiraceae bacterium]
MIHIDQIDFEKGNGLVPVIAQDAVTRKVLMMGYCNAEAVNKTVQTGHLCFYSRAKKRLWTKGEESGHFLAVQSLTLDCDQDTILAKVIPNGPTCHKGTDTCWGEVNENETFEFLSILQKVIVDRKSRFNVQESYIANLFANGINKIAQKVGEEAVELVIEAKDDNTDLFLGEAADLLFHYLILLQAKGQSLEKVVNVLKSRHK